MSITRLASIELSKDVPLLERIVAVAPNLNKAIQDWEAKKLKLGVGAFDVELRRFFIDAKLLEIRIYQEEKAGIHPDNREEEMAIPVDVQDLLMRMTEDGRNELKRNAFSCTITSCSEGQRCRDANMKLIFGLASLSCLSCSRGA